MVDDHSVRRPPSARQISAHAVIVPALLALAGAAAYGQTPPLTERRAIELTLAQPAQRIAESGPIDVAESAVAQAGLPPNPVFAAERQRMSTPGGQATETTLQLSHAFDLAGRRGLQRDAAQHRLHAAQWDREAARSRLVADVRTAFADALYRDGLRGSLQRLRERVDAAHKRVEALAPSGELLPGEMPPLAAIESMLQRRPDLQSLEAQAAAFDSERRYAERTRLPDLTFGAGTSASRSRAAAITASSSPFRSRCRCSIAAMRRRGARNPKPPHCVPSRRCGLAAGRRNCAAPMATVILFGLLSSTLLNMFVVPSLYLRFGSAGRMRHDVLSEPAKVQPA